MANSLHRTITDQVGFLLEKSENDAVKKNIVHAVNDALNAGPLTPEEALQHSKELFEGPRQTRLQRSFRLAAFIPGDVPIIDPNMPAPWQERAAKKLRQQLAGAIASGASFTPAAYAEKARRIQAINTEADKRAQKLKERILPRGWNDVLIAEALANGPGIPVLGYPYCAALLRFHPETFLPIVFCAESDEVIHVGRKHYVYSIDWDAYHAIPEQERPPLPIWCKRFAVTL